MREILREVGVLYVVRVKKGVEARTMDAALSSSFTVVNHYRSTLPSRSYYGNGNGMGVGILPLPSKGCRCRRIVRKGIPRAQGKPLNHDYAAAVPSTRKVDDLINKIKWDNNGLVVAIAQHVDTGAILMQGFANREAILATLESGRATFYSRSRATLWTKGETSHNFINVMDVYVDCDRDSFIYLGKPDGPTCHTGAETCYFTHASNILSEASEGNEKCKVALSTLYMLEDTIHRRKNILAEAGASHPSKPSWTMKLLGDEKLLCSKIREEADELCRTVEEVEGSNRTASEAADVLYHMLVLLAVQDVKVEQVLEVLRARFSQSGIEEKSNRKKAQVN